MTVQDESEFILNKGTKENLLYLNHFTQLLFKMQLSNKLWGDCTKLWDDKIVQMICATHHIKKELN